MLKYRKRKTHCLRAGTKRKLKTNQQQKPQTQLKGRYKRQVENDKLPRKGNLRKTLCFFFFFFFLAFAVYTIKAAREMNDVVFSSSCLQP